MRMVPNGHYIFVCFKYLDSKIVGVFIFVYDLRLKPRCREDVVETAFIIQ